MGSVWSHNRRCYNNCIVAEGNLGEFMRTVGGLESHRSMGAAKSVIGQGMVDFEFFAFLSVAMSSLKGSWVTWWFKYNLLPW
jgi:hypothetical protein